MDLSSLSSLFFGNSRALVAPTRGWIDVVAYEPIAFVAQLLSPGAILALLLGAAVLVRISCVRAARRRKRALAAKSESAHSTGGRVFADDCTGMNRTEVRAILYPLNAGDVVEAVLKAKAEGAKIIARGTQHCMGKQAIAAGGYILDMRFLNRVLDINPVERTAVVQPGATWTDLIRKCDPFGLSPRTMQSYSSFSIGGTIAVSAHGITNDYSMQECVLEMRVVTAEGKEITVRRGDPLFGLIIGGFGLFGIITAVKLKLDVNAQLELEYVETNARSFPGIYMRALADPTVAVKIARVNIVSPDQQFLYLFRAIPGTERTVSRVSEHARRAGSVSRLLYKWLIPQTAVQRLRYRVESFLRRPLDWTGAATRNGLMYESASPLQQLYNPLLSVDSTHILQEYFIPLAEDATAWSHWHAFLKASLDDHLSNDRHIRLLNITIRCVRKDDVTRLAYASKSDVLAFVLYYRVTRSMAADAELERMHKRLATKALELGGCFYLPYRHHYDIDMLRQAYPASLESFFVDKLVHDPHELFSNEWYTAWKTQVLTDEQRVEARKRGLKLLAMASASLAPIPATPPSEEEEAADGEGLTASQRPSLKDLTIASSPAALLARPEPSPIWGVTTPEKQQSQQAFSSSSSTVRSGLIRTKAPALPPRALELALQVRPRGDHHYAKVLRSPALRSSLLSFFANVFTVEPAAEMLACVDAAFAAACNAVDFHYAYGTPTAASSSSVPANSVVIPMPADADVYRNLVTILAARGNGALGRLSYRLRHAKRSIQQLSRTRDQITGEAAALLTQLGLGQGQIDGWVAIGDPGRYVLGLRERLGITGRQFVVNDYGESGVGAVLERQSIRAVGTFVSIDYSTSVIKAASKGSGKRIPPSSVDLVTFFQGLHHQKPENLPAFIATIFRALRPGGVFIIREHACDDVSDTDTAVDGVFELAHLAHSTFNAVTGVSASEEASEVRAFRSIRQWRELVETFGFVDTRCYEMQDLDPTADIMMAFRKPLDAVDNDDVDDRQSSYTPSFSPSVSTGGASFMSPGSASGFIVPSTSPIKVPGTAASVAGGVSSISRRPGSSAAIAAVRQALSTTSVGIHDRLPAATFHTLTEWLLVEVPQRYGKFLEHTPWFMFPYMRLIRQFWSLFAKESRLAVRYFGVWGGLCNEYLVMNITIGAVLTLVFAQLSVLAIIPRWTQAEIDTTCQIIVAAQGNNGELPDLSSIDEDINVLVPWMSGEEATAAAATSEEDVTASATKQSPLKAASSALRSFTKTRLPQLVGDDRRHYAAIEVPRYRPFGRCVKALASAGIQVVQVGGVSEVMQVRVLVDNDRQVAWLKALGPQAQYLFEFTDPGDESHREVALAVSVSALTDVLLALERAGIAWSRVPPREDRVHLHDY